MPKVVIVQMGPLATGLNLKAVTKVANKGQKHFEFVLGDPTNLGEPTEGEYKVADLATLLEARRTQECVDIVVGVTDQPLYWELFSGIDGASNNIVITTAKPAASLLSRVNKSTSAYVLVEIAAQLLAIEYRRLVDLSAEPEESALPWHLEPKTCLFDYCDDERQTIQKLITPKLCPQCLALLDSANVRESVKKACLSLAKRGVRPRFIQELRSVLGDPVGRFIFGGVFSLLVVAGLAKLGVDAFRVSLFLLVLLFLVIVFIIIRNRWRSRNDLF